ncbi:hypothetical protein J008_02731 [Cryptococcus neoformans]|uniref:W2 domain-containing protein n=2 Tax=Cryptococcus neoformans TaxID=5207 RepID=A0A854QDF0_CRYNE|nr:hypothetical protein CNAG_01270 [Cryptococcus neoformans var. grubii H99]AUB24600.1 hypothetical protein CKF44_01270 [Cryptococcus neoformans var. grubii]OWT39857.1 hypothetical protein C362_02353 [Cryptococcus neoformans var. grubii Bt1]OWZ32326.1 hypothetical protein C347_03023 [Cryptococcus neoformans var. grubii AD2-60a]OWZ44173.1 hypothetical protein C343_02960 [Cryptococcus neoformans var. grubii C23]OWZ44606.1 hypothetical protein C353_02863 [Cryptococcus neoformans var. grubii AD1-8|eukprot:XP_012049431.1 hypothetical protein CNAG_01270 [Cryptococcus neoformans var. grubii H99]
MSHTPTSTASGNAPTTDKKPSLTGVRIKQRKGQAKATAKFEPEAFRDALLLHLALLPHPITKDALVAKLVQAGSTLEFLKYSEQLFELLFVGGLLQPGGSYLDDKRSPVYILQPDDAPDAFQDGVKGMIEVLKRVMQRYKYLQKPLEENFLPGVLSYLPKWDVKSREKLAEAIALLTIELQISSRCLQSLAKEHVVKDNVALNFLTAFIKTYLSRQSIDQFGSTLRRSGLKSILAVFPLQIRDRKHLEAHFREENLQVVNDWYAKLALGEVKDETVQAVERMINDDETSDQIVEALKLQQSERPVSEADISEWIWLALMGTVDWTARSDQIDTFVISHITRYASILETFCQSAKAQVNLINAVQVYCYTDTRIIKSFVQILKVLYNADVVSDQAIIYWHQKGAKPNGKGHFLKVAEPLVKFLSEQESDSEEE